MAPRLRQEYPGVPPWEWDAHPVWLGRVQCGLVAEIEGAQIRKQHDEQGNE